MREVAVRYEARLPLLEELAATLMNEVQTTLEDVPGITLVEFRVMTPDSFARKSFATQDGVRTYEIPLADIEDQVAGTILLSVACDIDGAVNRLREEFNVVRCEASGELVLMIPPHVVPAEWSTLEFPPTTFEMRVSHAEPENDVSSRSELPPPEKVAAETTDEHSERELQTLPHAGDRRVKVFVSYAPFDTRFLESFEKHVSSLRREGLVDVWHQQRVAAGEDWRVTSAAALQDADIILLMISADFIASDFCYDVELKQAIQRDRAGTARVIPISIRRVDWGKLPFADLPVLPRNRKPISRWEDVDDAWAEVAQEIRKVVTRLRGEVE